MILVENYTLAVLLCILAMICWGSWQNTQPTGKLRFELYYWDFILGIFFSLVMAFTFGSMGNMGRSFIQDLRQATRRISSRDWQLSEFRYIVAGGRYPLPACRLPSPLEEE
jgi:glucose uptake protein